MYVVYVLYSARYDRIYVGYTSHLIERIRSHNLYGKDWTKGYRPWIVIHVEVFDSKSQAMNRERQLKGGKGRHFIREIVLPDYLKSSSGLISA